MNEPDPAGLHTLVTKSDAPIHRATYVTTEAAASEAMIAIARHMIAESFSKLSHAEKVVFFVIVAHARFSHQYTGLVCMEEPDTLWARAAVRRGGWHPAVNRLEELGFIRRIKRGGCLHDHYEIVVPPDPNEQPFVSDSIIEIGSLRPAGRDATRALPSRWTGRNARATVPLDGTQTNLLGGMLGMILYLSSALLLQREILAGGMGRELLSRRLRTLTLTSRTLG